MICQVEPHNTILDPCGHGGLCSTCAQRMMADKTLSFCPICKTKIDLVLVYKLIANKKY